MLLGGEAHESFGVVDQELEDVQQGEFEGRGHGDSLSCQCLQPTVDCRPESAFDMRQSLYWPIRTQRARRVLRTSDTHITVPQLHTPRPARGWGPLLALGSPRLRRIQGRFIVHSPQPGLNRPPGPRKPFRDSWLAEIRLIDFGDAPTEVIPVTLDYASGNTSVGPMRSA